MSRRIYALLSKRGQLMKWAEKVGYQPPVTVDDLNIQIWATEDAIWRLDHAYGNGDVSVLDEIQGLSVVLESLKAQRDKLWTEDGDGIEDIHSVILHIRPAGAADE